MLSMSYALVTPVKNEKEKISRMFLSVVEQKSRPRIWIIVDDGSTDGSAQLLDKLCDGYKWIKVYHETINKEYSWLGYANVIHYAIKKINDSKSKYKYLGILDSDIFVESNYFSTLEKMLELNPDIGVVSGEIYIQSNGKWIIENHGKNPRGGARLYQKTILDKIGGFPLTPSPDLVSDIKICNKGYLTRRVQSARAWQMRPTFSRHGWWKGYLVYGKSRYFLGYNLIHVMLLIVKFSLTHRPVILSAVPYIIGFFQPLIANHQRFPDPEVVQYSRNFTKRLYEKIRC